MMMVIIIYQSTDHVICKQQSNDIWIYTILETDQVASGFIVTKFILPFRNGNKQIVNILASDIA